MKGLRIKVKKSMLPHYLKDLSKIEATEKVIFFLCRNSLLNLNFMVEPRVIDVSSCPIEHRHIDIWIIHSVMISYGHDYRAREAHDGWYF